MLLTTVIAVQIDRDSMPSGSPPIGNRMLSDAAVPPSTPPICRILESAIKTQSRLIQPTGPIFGGTLL
jgi:hypothetical protein